MAETTEKLNGILRKKVAGIPVLYIAGVAVAILAYVAYRTPTKASGDVGADVGTDTTDQSSAVSDALDPSAYGALSSNGTVTVSQPGSTQSVDVTTVQTNDTWLANGVALIIASGLATGGTAQLALQKYIAGDQLSYDEGKLRDLVIAKQGIPPEPIVVGGTAAAPILTKRQGTPPITHIVKGTDDNNYPKLATLYYPTVEVHEAIDLLQVHNRGIARAGSFAPGTRVYIPKYSKPVYATSTKALATLHQFAVKGGIPSSAIQELNDGVKFPVKPGVRVRIG